MLLLKPANYADAEAEWRFVAAMPADENGLTNDWPGVSREDFLQIALPRMLAWSRGEDLPPGFVPETFLFLWDGETIVGQFRLRHHLTEALRKGAGHIGYYVAPEHRRCGYATEGLRLALAYARDIVPEGEFYLRVNRNNPASLRVMLKNGGRIAAGDADRYYVRIARAESPRGSEPEPRICTPGGPDMRNMEITRKTAETDIFLSLDLDGTGKGTIDTGVGFLNHMLTLFSRHGRFDLTVRCAGDTDVDDHHSVEDIGICLGQAFKAALGDKRGICRYGSMLLPMDEALVLAAVDISGRAHLEYALDIPTEKVGTFDTELVREFWLAFVRAAELTLHIRQLSGLNAHHIIEASFKALGRALAAAARIDGAHSDEIPSTKGLL